MIILSYFVDKWKNNAIKFGNSNFYSTFVE